MNGFSHSTVASAPLRRTLFASTAAIEVAAVITIGWVGYRLATQSGGSWQDCVPLLLLGAAETVRLPLSAAVVSLRPFAQICAVLTLVATAAVSGETISLGFEQLVDSRIAVASEAKDARDAAKQAVEASGAEHDRLAGELDKARAALTDLVARQPTLTAVPSVRPQVCHGRRSDWDCSSHAAADATARTNSDLARAYNDRVRASQEAVRTAESRLEALPSPKTLEAGLEAAETRYRASKASSPMTRLAEAIFGGDLTDRQFNLFKSVVVLTLGFSVPTIVTVVGLLAHAAPREAGRESKLSRSLRRLIARYRKRIVRIVARPVETRVKEFVFVPFDTTTGSVTGEPRLHAVDGGKRG